MVQGEDCPGGIAADGSDVARLLGLLQAHDGARSMPLEVRDEARRIELLRACCLIVAAGPSDPDIPWAPTDSLRETLNAPVQGNPPEAEICRIWLDCCAGKRPEQACSRLAELATGQIWHPIAALLYRALASCGHRQLLGSILSKTRPLAPAEADAWFEAAHIVPIAQDWTEGVIGPPSDLLPPILCGAWQKLLSAEAAIALGRDSQATHTELSALLGLVQAQTPGTYACTESRRIAARAAAALVRASLNSDISAAEVLASPAALGLAAWERDYLEGLVRWRTGDSSGAERALRSGLTANPRQHCIRLAIAALVAPDAPGLALEVLSEGGVTREAEAARAALLARLGHYEQAATSLEAASTLPTTPVRYRWARGWEQYSQLESSLRTALAEHRGDWNAAAKAWNQRATNGQKTLQLSRRLFMDRRELESTPATRGWTRDETTFRLNRRLREVGSIPLVGDALFFRAAGSMEREPARTAKDFIALLHQRSWVARECRVGASRIIFAADVLLSLGHGEAAAQGYALANRDGRADVADRLSLARLCAEAARGARPAEIRATEGTVSSVYAPLLAATGMLSAHDLSGTMEMLDKAQQRGASSATCRCIRALAVASTASREDLSALRVPPQVLASFRLLCGEGPITARIQEYIEAMGDDWMDRCPVDPVEIARRLLAEWCDESKWDDALSFCVQIERLGYPWAAELAAIVRLRHALMRAAAGNLEEAEREIRLVESALARNAGEAT